MNRAILAFASVILYIEASPAPGAVDCGQADNMLACAAQGCSWKGTFTDGRCESLSSDVIIEVEPKADQDKVGPSLSGTHPETGVPDCGESTID